MTILANTQNMLYGEVMYIPWARKSVGEPFLTRKVDRSKKDTTKNTKAETTTSSKKTRLKNWNPVSAAVHGERNQTMMFSKQPCGECWNKQALCHQNEAMKRINAAFAKLTHGGVIGLMGPLFNQVQTRQGFFCATPNERASSACRRKSLPLAPLRATKVGTNFRMAQPVRNQSGKKRQQGRRQLNGHVQFDVVQSIPPGEGP